jgi:DNA repair exonuclease SbcCD nuclease subunit
MPIRLIHTADNHVGMTYKQYSPLLQQRLIDERLSALARVVDAGNSENADFLVVAGDLFDSLRVSQASVEAVATLLGRFDGTATLVVPGNHDYSCGADSRLWKSFRQAAGEFSNLLVLDKPQVKRFEVNGQVVDFYPCPCPSKTGSESTIAWVQEYLHDPQAVRIGIAHGNVSGLGLDQADKYFNMRPEELQEAGMTAWLLGHIHVPFPSQPSGHRSAYFMAGTHTPDSLRCRHGGTAWQIDITDGAVSSFVQLRPGKLRFVRLRQELTGGHDLERLQRECQALDAATTILDLQLVGQLHRDHRALLEQQLQQLREEFLELTSELDISQPLDAEQIQRNYPSEGLAHRLLMQLLADDTCPEAAGLARDLIEEVSGT